ncbi:MAG: Rieske 2Fe-2S domain-containing protein [bacterium]|nr:Rieske 2Fe-2S domain-containing protein [bacterium]
MAEPTTFDTQLAPDALDPERPVPFDTPWGHFALYTIEGRVVCAESFCPHLLGPLFQGTQSDDEVTCPWHLWRFSLTTGECTHAPTKEAMATIRIRRLAVEVGEKGTFVLRPLVEDEG